MRCSRSTPGLLHTVVSVNALLGLEAEFFIKLLADKMELKKSYPCKSSRMGAMQAIFCHFEGHSCIYMYAYGILEPNGEAVQLLMGGAGQPELAY